MKGRFVFVLALAGYLGLAPLLATSMRNRPLAIKAGFLPQAEIIKIFTGEFHTLFANWAVVRTLFYFGEIFEMNQRNVNTHPEYEQMYSNLVQALKLDPYNQDIYYFSQAIFTWDVGRIRETNRLLVYGMKYRTSDWQLPFWIGFNDAYFLKDYPEAARYFQRAAELSGESLFTNLAARYFHEAGEDQLGIVFLETMIKSASDERVRKIYQLRHDALVAASELRRAVRTYQEKYGYLPLNLESLVRADIIKKVPSDPYGGKFFLDDQGHVKSTSKFAFASPKNKATGENEKQQPGGQH